MSASPAASAERPNVLLISVDTLRTDRMTSYGHHRPTTPEIDALLERGVRFAEARTPAPLTAPAMASVMTSLYPHDHGSTRNGLRVRAKLVSFSNLMERRGYRTAAVVGNWTLKPDLSGLDEHFDSYSAILNRARWFGLAKREATAEDLNAEALEWLDGHLEEDPGRPFLLWVHYVEPHAPYQLRGEYSRKLGIKKGAGVFSPKNRYDTEIAYVDERIGRMLDEVYSRVASEDTLVIFAADHGESLGEHGYWGHGRHLYDVTLRVPMGFVWPGRIEPGTVIDAPASLLDLAPTTLGLLGFDNPPHFEGLDWTAVLDGRQPQPMDRVTWHQAHRASVQPKEGIERLRRRGLLEVARFANREKEIFRVTNGRRRVFDLDADPAEKASLTSLESVMSSELDDWLGVVRVSLAAADELPPPSLSEDDIAALRALGYID